MIVRINYTSNNISSVEGILSDLSKLNKDQKQYLQIDLQRVWQDKSKYVDETSIIADNLREKFIKNGFNVLLNNLSQDVRYSCYGDKKNHILINFNGDVYGCTARDFNKKNSLGHLQRNGIIIYDEKFRKARWESKFSKPICQTCRIAPLCGGGCRQRSFEDRDNPECTFGYSEEDIDKKILDLFEFSFIRK